VTEPETPLSGGNMTGGVVRVGDTVRRPAGPWTPAVHALLAHLHAVGFGGAPRPLGIDERGREVLTYLPGVVPWPDRVELVGPEDRLRRVARLIRDLHDAVADFVPPADARWQVLIPAEVPAGSAGLIAHHDLAPWNLVVHDDRWAFIDWDVAAPGSREWDVAYAMRGFVPLTANPSYRRDDAAGRLRVFADAYGLSEGQRSTIVTMLARRAVAMHDFLADGSRRGLSPWARLWREGHGDAWHADAEYIAARESRWRAALLD
jgi:Ser/Thr protein kinase RdoA (MazF antagonist)